MVQSSSDQLFVIEENGSLRSEPLRSMREGVLGKSLEEGLQTLIERYPQIIPGSQIEPGSENPPNFVLLGREMPVGSWSLDLILADQFGIPTLIEAKLIENPESRRSVMGQILEYAANAASEWGSGKLQQKASEYWAKKNRKLEEVLLEKFGDNDKFEIGEFWEEVEENLAKGKMRLIVAADGLRPEVRRVIEYLNAETKNIEILGLELRCYGRSATSVILSPLIIGQTQATTDRKGASSRQTRDWDERSFFRTVEAASPETLETVQKIYQWFVDHNMPFRWGRGVGEASATPSFRPFGTDLFMFFTIVADPSKDNLRIRIPIGTLRSVRPFTEKSYLQELLDRLNRIHQDLKIESAVIDSDKGKYPNLPVSLLQNEEAMKQFLDTVEWTIRQIQEPPPGTTPEP